MIPYIEEIVLTKGIYTIIYQNGYAGLKRGEDEIVIEPVFNDIYWEGDYLVLYDGEKYGIVHESSLNSL